METTVKKYSYVFLKEDQLVLIEEAAACLSHTFVGIEVNGKIIQEPMVGLLHLEFEDFYQFCKDYLLETVSQGYSAVALNEEGHVVAVFCGDTNSLEVIEEDLFEGSFKDMNIILRVLEEVDRKFIDDFEKRYNKKMENGDVLHLFLLGVIAKENRHEIVRELGDLLINRAREENVKLMIAEATNPKSMSLLERFHNMTKYVDINGDFIVHKYKDNEILKAIPEAVADGTYIITKEL